MTSSPVSEDTVHRAILKMIRQDAPHIMVWHTPNANPRGDMFEGFRVKKLGVRAGVHDLILVPPGAILHTLEIKKPGATASAVSPEQRMFGRELEERGGKWAMVRSVDEARKALNGWGLL